MKPEPLPIVEDRTPEQMIADGDAAPDCALSWNGFNVHGDKKSIDEVHKAVQALAVDPELRTLLRHQREELGKLHSRVATLEYEIKAKAAECEIADGEIERLKTVLSVAEQTIRIQAEDIERKDFWLKAGDRDIDRYLNDIVALTDRAVKAETERDRLRSALGFVAPALFVLRNILKDAKLKAGEAKANEMIAYTQEVLAKEPSPAIPVREIGTEP